MNQNASFVLSELPEQDMLLGAHFGTRLGVRLGVLGAVVLLHLLFIWAAHVGFGREIQPTPPTVVARLIVQPISSLKPASPLQPVKAAAHQSAAPSQAVAIEPTVVSVMPAPASAPPAVIAPVAALTPTISVAAAGASAGAALGATHGTAAPVRLAAELQASGTCQKPAYPDLSRRREEQGSVQLKFLIAADGHVVESQIEQSSGYARLDEAARAGLSKCQFRPGTVDGKPEPSWASMKYTWRLE